MHKGLSPRQVEIAQSKFGKNVLHDHDQPKWPGILFAQFKSPLIYILFFVAIVSLFMGEYFDAILALVVVAVNSLMGFYQEYNAQKTLTALRKILKPKAIVIRSAKKVELDISELVPGDLVVLASGDKVPADGFLIEGMNLLLNEAVLTGESMPIAKIPDKDNLFMGTEVIAGRGIMRVDKTGASTEIGKIGKSLTEIKEEKTPLQTKLEVFTRRLAWVILAVCIFIFAMGLLRGIDIMQILRMSIVLVVAAIPEGLPIAVTIILALGMRRILKKKGLVKKLLSIETLGATSVICTDKTGTLTEGVMRVVKTKLTDKDKALLTMTLANDQKSGIEVALWNYVKNQKENPQSLFNCCERIFEEPFDSEKKYMMSVNLDKGEKNSYLVGAPEKVILFCKISPQEKDEYIDLMNKWASSGLRILGLATKQGEGYLDKTGFTWLGLLGIRDPIREGVKETIKSAMDAGIKVKIVTGDYRTTAEVVAKNLGFDLDKNNIIEGEELEATPDEVLERRIDRLLLFTRVTPHQKLKIIKALQKRGEVVAMTGDGVNDAPALKKANIGVVVGSAVEVAKEAGDLILLDSNFKTIVAACEEGRLIFSNIKKVVGYVLSNSFVEIFLIFGAMVLNLAPPLLVVQILWIHIICDGPPDIVLGFEEGDKSLMQEKPRDLKKASVLSGSMIFLIISISLIIGLFALYVFDYFVDKTSNLTLARSIIFASIAAVDLIYIFSFKNLKTPILLMKNFFANKYLFWAVLYGFVLILAAIYIPYLNTYLGTTPLRAEYWLIVIGLGIFATIWVELIKLIARKKI